MPMRPLREVVRNPFGWECHCADECWCQSTRWGYWVMYYVPPRFHRFPPKQPTRAEHRSAGGRYDRASDA